jgi:hypothetical protein
MKVKVKEGTLEIDEHRILLRHTVEAGLFENVFLRLVNFIKGKEDLILLKDITMVVAEPGLEEKMCPHILVYYGAKSRLIEFCIEKKNQKGKTNMQKVLDLLEKKGIEIGVGVQL